MIGVIEIGVVRPCLNHKVTDGAVENKPVVEIVPNVVQQVFDGIRRLISKKLNDDIAKGCVQSNDHAVSVRYRCHKPYDGNK